MSIVVSYHSSQYCSIVILIVIVVLFILIGVAGGSSSSSNQDASSSAHAGSDALPVRYPNCTLPLPMLLPFTVSAILLKGNGVKVTLVRMQKQVMVPQYLTPSAGNIFVTLEFEIENDSSSDINVSSIASFEAYCDDYSVTESITAVALSDKSTL